MLSKVPTPTCFTLQRSGDGWQWRRTMMIAGQTALQWVFVLLLDMVSIWRGSASPRAKKGMSHKRYWLLATGSANRLSWYFGIRQESPFLGSGQGAGLPNDRHIYQLALTAPCNIFYHNLMTAAFCVLRAKEGRWPIFLLYGFSLVWK